MIFKKKEQPVAFCSECGAFGNSVQYIGERCGKPIGGNRCGGTRQNARNRDHWKQCAKCDATGRYSNEECPLCLGRGWFYLMSPVQEAI